MMSKMRRFLLWVLGALLLAACAGGPPVFVPAPTPTVSPIRVPKAIEPVSFIPGVWGAYQSCPKRGVGLTYSRCDDVSATHVAWYYTWGTEPIRCAGAEAVPMLWGRSAVGEPVSGDGEWLMGFNEPDRPDQANMAPAEAAMLWRQVEHAYVTRRLLSPAPSHMNLDWLVKFWQAYIDLYGAPPRLDALAVHCYLTTAAECQSVIMTVAGWAEDWGVPGGVWLTEFAFVPEKTLDWAEQTIDFIAWLDANPAVARYAWFASRIVGNEPWYVPGSGGSLLDPQTDNLTQFGQEYVCPRPDFPVAR